MTHPVLPPFDSVQFLQDLVACSSVTPETAGVLDVVETALTALGFAVTRLRFEGDNSYPVDNLFALRARGGRSLLFAGHTDVVPPGDAGAWRFPPFSPTVHEGKLYGRGTADMKSGIAAFVGAAAKAIAEGSAENGTLAFAITNDEEADAVNGTAKLMDWAKRQGHRFDFAIVGEPSAKARVGDSIKIGRRGSLSGQITVTGVQGHVAYPEKARNPLPALARIVADLSAMALDQGTAHFSASNLEFTTIDVGNPTGNLIPAKGTARFNIRFNDTWTPHSLEQHLRGRLARIDTGGYAVALDILGQASNAFLSPLGKDVDALCQVIQHQTGSPPELSTGGGTSDARFIAQYCPVAELGLPGPSMHKTNEHVLLTDIHDLETLYHTFIRAFFAP